MCMVASRQRLLFCSARIKNIVNKMVCGGCSMNNRCIICAGAYVKSVNPTMYNMHINETLVDTCLMRIGARINNDDDSD